VEKMQNWRAVYVASRSEKKVNERLQKEGITAYLPLQRILRQWSDRKKWVEVPLLNGYVFIQITEAERMAVLNVPGVVQFVRYNGADAVIRPEEIAVLRQVETKGYAAEFTSQTFEKDDLVLVTEGPFKGLHARILEDRDEQRVIAWLMEGMGQALRITIPKEVLERHDAVR
jgi:transcription antitermination factor NusG